MSERLYLYVEKILSRIVVDDAQRREIEHEIRLFLLLLPSGNLSAMVLSGQKDRFQSSTCRKD